MSITFGPSTPITNRSDLVNMTPPPPPSCGLVVGTGALDSLPPTASEGPVSFCVGPKPLLTSGMRHGPSPVTQSIAQEIDSIVEREQAFCRDYKCCGSQLADLFELLDHFEECHVGEDGQVVISPCLLPMANGEDQTDRFHTGEDSGCDHVEHGSRPSDTCDRLPPAMSSGSDGDNVLREFKLKPSRQSGDQQQRAPSPRRPTHLLSLSPKSMANKSPSSASAPASPPLTPPAEQAAADYISRFQKDNGSNPAADASSGFPTASACANTGRTGDRTPPQSSAAPPGVWSPEPSPHRLSSTRLTSTDPPRAPSPETLRIALSVAQEWCATNAATPSDPFAFPGATGLQSPPPTSLVRSPDVNWHSRTALTAGMPASPVSPMAMHIDPPTPCPYPFQGWAGTGTAPTNASHKRTRAAALARVGGLGIDSDVDLSESDMSDMDSKGSAGKDSKSAVGAQKDVVRYHPCTVEGCVRGYQTTSGLRTHLASVHGIVFPSHLPPTKSSLSSSTSSTSRSSTLAALDQPSGVAFQCPVPTCPRSYASKSGLKYHILSSHQGLAQAASSGGGSSAPAPAAASTAAKLPVAAGARRKRKTRRVSDSPPLSSTSVTGLASSSGGSHASPPPPMPGQQQQPKFSQPPMPVKTPNKDVPPRRSLRQASRDADKRRGA